MWLCTQLGFFSVVRKEGDQCFHVRARTHQDLVNLCEAVSGNCGIVMPQIETWPLADYRYRIIVIQDVWISIMNTLVLSVDYPNFKNQIASDPQQREKLEGYSQLWHEGREWQSHCPHARVQAIVNTSVDDVRSGLWNMNDLLTLQLALAACEAAGQKTKATLLRRRIHQLPREISP